VEEQILELSGALFAETMLIGRMSLFATVILMLDELRLSLLTSLRLFSSNGET
jgi:hypothetical protein